MLSFYHIKVPARLGVSEQGGRGRQRGEAHASSVCHGTDGAGLRLAHPLRDLQHGETGAFAECAPKHGRAGPAVHCLDAYSASKALVPQVAHFQEVGMWVFDRSVVQRGPPPQCARLSPPAPEVVALPYLALPSHLFFPCYATPASLVSDEGETWCSSLWNGPGCLDLQRLHGRSRESPPYP